MARRPRTYVLTIRRGELSERRYYSSRTSLWDSLSEALVLADPLTTFEITIEAE